MKIEEKTDRIEKMEKMALSRNLKSTTASHNPSLVGLRCLRCDKFYELEDSHIDSGLGCSTCMQEDYPVSLRCIYQKESKLSIDKEATGLFRFVSKLPFVKFPSLGEGQTPLVSLEKLAIDFGVEQVLVKNEGQNPTGSHKDRMSPLAIARALAAGYDKVAASSSGNAGASLAAYAARAGIKCCIIASDDITASWANAIKLTGAELRLVASDQRWPLMRQMSKEDGWFPVTNLWPIPIGSNPFGIEGYKTIAYEIVEQTLNAPPTVVVVPTCRGDMLFGISRGFIEAHEAGLLAALPRLIAAEPGRRLELVLAGDDYRSSFEVANNNMTSIGGGTATYQSFQALSSSSSSRSGHAVSVTSSDAVSAQEKFAQNGLYVEMSSAASLAGLHRLQEQNLLKSSDRVVLIATSHGYKEPPNMNNKTDTRFCN